MSTPTLEEVARAAAVSRSTASQVVNGSPTVGGVEARQSVERAVAQFGYVPNRVARSNVTRRLGNYDALRAAGRTPDADLEESGGFTREGGQRSTEVLLQRCPDVEAVFAASDLTAVGAPSALYAAGRRVAEDVAVVGFDDSIIALSTQPALSSVHQSTEVTGRELVGVLLQTVDARDHVLRRVVLETELIVRQSSGGPPTGKN